MDVAPLSDLTGDVSFAASAKIRILLAPVAGAGLRSFEPWAALVRRFGTLRLADLPRTSRPRNSVPADSALARKGEVHLSFVTSYDPAHAFLAPFSLSHQVLIVLGLATAHASDGGDPPDLAGATQALRDQHPNALIHRVVAFDADQPDSEPPDEEGDLGAGDDDGQEDGHVGVNARAKTNGRSNLSGDQVDDEQDQPNWADQVSPMGTWRHNAEAKPKSSRWKSNSTNHASDYDPYNAAEQAKLQALHDQLVGQALATTTTNRDNQDPASSPESKSNNTNSKPDGAHQQELVVVPAQRSDGKDARHHVKRVLGEIVSTLLDQLEQIVHDLKGIPLETPRDTLEGGLSSLLALHIQQSHSHSAAPPQPQQQSSSGESPPPAATPEDVAADSVFGISPDHLPPARNDSTTSSSSTNWDRASSLFSFGGSTKPELPTSGFSTPVVETPAAGANKRMVVGGGQQPESLQFGSGSGRTLIAPIRSASSSGLTSSLNTSRPTSLASSNSLTSTSTSSKTFKKALETKRLSSASWRSHGSKNTTTGGSGPQGEGRHTKVLADLALLSGDLWSAMSYYDLAMKWMGKERSLAGGQDAVWYASALEGWAVTRALMARLGKGVEERASTLPVGLSVTGKDKDKESAKREREKDGTADLPYEGLPWESIARAYTVAISIYAKCLSPLSVLLAPTTAVSSDSPRDFTHPLIHASACVQYARFLIAVWSCRGWNGECFDQLLYGGTPLLLRGDSPPPDEATLIRWSLDAGIRRDEVASAASQALTLSVPALKARDQVVVLSSMASIFGWLGFVRRETYLLRRLLASVMDWVQAVSFAHRTDHPQVKQVLRIRLGEVAPGLHIVWNSASRAKCDFDALLVLAAQICDTYGIQLDSALERVPDDHALARTRDVRRLSALGTLRPTAARQLWSKDRYRPADTLLGVEPEDQPSMSNEAFGWTEVQALVLKDALAMAETLEDSIAMAVFGSVLLRDYAPLLAAWEQSRLASGLDTLIASYPSIFAPPPPKATTTATSKPAAQGTSTSPNELKGKTQVKYWGPRELVARMDLLGPSETKKVTERSRSVLHPTNPAESKMEESNPFFWNPARGVVRTGGQKVTVVSDDEVTASVVLYNPLDIALDLVNIQLSVMGVRFDPRPLSALIKPKSFLRLRLVGTPKDTGTLVLKGAKITLRGCAPEEIHLASIDPSTELAWVNAHADLEDRRLRTKATGLPARYTRIPARVVSPSSADDPSSSPFEKHLALRVVLPQPTLELESMSLPEGKLVLYEGETREVRLHLRNVCLPSSPKLPVDYITLQFEDNLSSLARSTLSEGGLTPAATHALEYRLVSQPVLSRSEGDTPHSIQIDPGEAKSVTVRVFGRAGVMAATISVEYGCLDAPGLRSDQPTFFTRQLRLSFPVEVVRVVQPLAWALRPLMVNDLTGLMTANRTMVPFDAEENASMGAALAQAADEAEGNDMALISLDVKNVHPVRDLTVGFAYIPAQVVEGMNIRPGTGPGTTFQRTVPPNQRCRLVMPFPRLSLPPELESAPIPSLSRRQFTVARQGMTPEEDRQMRRKFWYTHLLYSGLRCFWHLPPAPEGGDTFVRGPHEGQLLLREVQDWSDAQIDLLRALPLSITLRTSPLPGATEQDDIWHDGASVVPAHQFVPIHADIINQLGRPIKLLYRLTPLPAAALDPNGALLTPGTPQVDDQTHPTDSILRHVLPASGSLTARVYPWPLPPGQSTRITKSFAFLACGSYAFVAAVEEVGPPGDDEDPADLPLPDKRRSSQAGPPLTTDDGGHHTRVIAVSRNRLEVRVAK